jgi:hypothetical protein
MDELTRKLKLHIKGKFCKAILKENGFRHKNCFSFIKGKNNENEN